MRGGLVRLQWRHPLQLLWALRNQGASVGSTELSSASSNRSARLRTGRVNSATSTACSQSVAVYFSSARSALLRTSVREILVSTPPGFPTRSARLAQRPERAESVIRGSVTGGGLPKYGPKAIANLRESPPSDSPFWCRRLREAEPTSLQMIRSDEHACLPFRPPMCAVSSESDVVSWKTVTDPPLRATMIPRRIV
jgi:hypothetical protein